MGKIFIFFLKVLLAVASQLIWYNEYIKVDNNTIYYCYFSQKNLNHIGDLFENNGKMRSWEDLIAKLSLDDNKKFYCLEKLNITELYNMQLVRRVEKPNAQRYFEKKFENPELEWKDIYILPRRVTINASPRIFQYKLLHNNFCLNETLYKF